MKIVGGNVCWGCSDTKQPDHKILKQEKLIKVKASLFLIYVKS